MKKLKITNNKNGSTLLLAMVIVSTILLTGVGVGLILSRQTRDAGVMRGEAVAHYIADSVIEDVAVIIGEGSSYTSQWDNFTEDGSIRYIAEEAEELGANKYRITVNVQNNYYSFVRELSIPVIEEDLTEKETLVESENHFLLYFSPPSNWSSEVEVDYIKYNSNNSWEILAVEEKALMQDSEIFSEWKVLSLERLDGLTHLWSVNFYDQEDYGKSVSAGSHSISNDNNAYRSDSNNSGSLTPGAP